MRWTIAATLPTLLGFGWADLRPDELQRASPANLEDRVGAGEALLAKVAEAHGVGVLARHETLTIVATDHWEGAGSWWPTDTQRFRADSTPAAPSPDTTASS